MSSPYLDSISLREDNVASDTSISLERPVDRMVANNFLRKKIDYVQDNLTVPARLSSKNLEQRKRSGA